MTVIELTPAKIEELEQVFNIISQDKIFGYQVARNLANIAESKKDYIEAVKKLRENFKGEKEYLLEGTRNERGISFKYLKEDNEYVENTPENRERYKEKILNVSDIDITRLEDFNKEMLKLDESKFTLKVYKFADSEILKLSNEGRINGNLFSILFENGYVDENR